MQYALIFSFLILDEVKRGVFYSVYYINIFFSTWDFFREHSLFTELQEKGKAISLTSLY